MEFRQLNLNEDLQRAIDEAGYVTATPVQELVFQQSFKGRDIYAQSQTGSGKTAAFLVSIFHRLLTEDSLRTRKVLILSPTRELAVQIEEEAEKLGKYLPFTTGAFYGGVAYGPQVDMLRNDVQFIIGTPGRIIDLVKQGKMLLKEVGFLVIDEADRMFDMGFIDDLRTLIRYLPPSKDRQTMLFSATLNVRVKNLAWDYMEKPEEIVIEPEHVTVDLVTQELYHVGSDEKFRFLLGLLKRENPGSCLIFANLKFIVEELCRRLKINGYDAEYIMGDLPQAKRLQVIDRLKEGKLPILVATDVAARGLDVESLDLVVNYDVPLDAESYVHRIGRTARAGKAGKAVTLACEKYVYGLPAIEKYINQKIPVCSFSDADLAEDKSAGLRFAHRHEEGRPERGGRSGGPRDRGRGGLDRSRHGDQGYRRPSGSVQHSVSEAAGRGATEPGKPRSERPHDDRRREQRGEERPRVSPEEERKLYSMSMDERMKVYREKYSGGERKEGSRSQGERSQGDRRQGDGRQQGGRSQGERLQGGKPQGNRQGGSRQEGGKSQGGQGQQRGNREGGQRQAQGKKPQAQRPQGEQRRGNGRGAPQGGRQAQRPAQAPAAKPGILDRIKALFGGKKKQE